jgi:hypothetical protein
LTLRLGSSKVSKHLILNISYLHLYVRIHILIKPIICESWEIYLLYIYHSTNLQYGTIEKSVRICRAIVLNRQCSKIEQYHLKYFAMFWLLYKRLQVLL